MIEVKNLVKKYGDHAAVDDLSFTVETGKVIGFLGPNGAGKSTTMNIITGYIAPTSGEVLVNGIDVNEEPEKAKKHIGYLPEIPPLYPDLRVREYLTFVAELKKVERAKRDVTVHKIMGRTGTLDVSERLIKNLSKGYKQRVGLAQAILGYPEIIILDEPTVGLDPKQIIEIRELIKKLSEKHTVILSSHILSEVSAVCDYVMIINHGKLVASDTTENLSKMTLGSNTLELTIKGTKEEVNKLVSPLEMIRELEWMQSEEEDCVNLKITTEERTDIREQLFYLMAEHKLPILKMESTRISLEDIFLELTEEGNEVVQEDSSEAASEEAEQAAEETEGQEEIDHDSDI